MGATIKPVVEKRPINNMILKRKKRRKGVSGSGVAGHFLDGVVSGFVNLSIIGIRKLDYS